MPTPHAPSSREHQPMATDERLLLLEEIDFKWLMAGQGWWIDTNRLHNDPDYAAHLFDLVKADALPALRECATLLRVQVVMPVSPVNPLVQHQVAG